MSHFALKLYTTHLLEKLTKKEHCILLSHCGTLSSALYFSELVESYLFNINLFNKHIGYLICIGHLIGHLTLGSYQENNSKNYKNSQN